MAELLKDNLNYDSLHEFAVRPFIIKHEQRMMAQMHAWTKHENEHLRRLASEGCRPALPWGVALNSFKKDPSPVLPILEQLKADPSAYVRKSVANNLNDISKTHPDLVIRLASEVSLKKNIKKPYDKAHSFADLSTRKHYPGTHSIALIVNGTERGKLDFELRNN